MKRECSVVPPAPSSSVTETNGALGLSLIASYREVRGTTDRLCAPLAVEDYVVQSMPDASPAKWHLAHTTWFFETFVLAALPGYRPFHPQYGYLFNSYYNAIGERVARDRRGTLSRPTVAEVHRYRAAIDERMLDFLECTSTSELSPWASTIVLGLNHEQQHQELILTDIKHAFGTSPLRPVYREQDFRPGMSQEAAPPRWVTQAEGTRSIGHASPGFSYDNESPRHRVFVAGFRLASRPTTCGEYLEFMADGGYRRPELWLSDGWDACRTQGWGAPLYWEGKGADWSIMTLSGMRPIEPSEPVCHVSYYEADAFARWSDARLPTEAEWEVAAAPHAVAGNFLDSGRYHPAPPSPADSNGSEGFAQLFGDVWEWTQSPYTPYPGYRPATGALGEYNGKFMCNQMVLRGGSCATPQSHIRATYRNFFPPAARWQFSGIRLANDL
ncbi:MAG TPA: ergothioneine biosynthesis protein EgtB [Isosphaeraceae bacterium]|jgi:ergothioneine biosynthesis protein EgtB|nr:ergothioneine biosynthesis protein EgtB [Isosphaeraceae bacterium]